MAEKYIQNKFIEFGLEDVHLEPFDITLWNTDQWSLSVDEKGISSFYIPYTSFTPASGPGLWISKSDGEYLLNIVKEKTIVNASILLNGTIEPGVTSNVVGFLPGKTDDIILVHTHHDAPFYGAVEDASGVSEVLALAKYFGQTQSHDRDKALMFLSASGHFYNYLGNITFIEKHKDDLVPKIVTDLCIEHIAREYDYIDGEIVETGRSELAGIFATTTFLAGITELSVLNNNLKRTITIPWSSSSEIDSDAMEYHEIASHIYFRCRFGLNWSIKFSMVEGCKINHLIVDQVFSPLLLSS